jgi:hypothetical protein
MKKTFDIPSMMKQANENLITALENQIQADIGGTRKDANTLANHILNILDANKTFKNVNQQQKNLFWVSLIIQDDEESKPWLCTKSSGFLTIEEAYQEIKYMREHGRVLSAWINIHEGDKTMTVFHECYIDVFGEVIYK